MKLFVVLMLTALPLYCYAGSGCQLLEDAVDKTIDPEVSVDEYTEYLAPYIHSDDTKEAVEEFKQCFLSQSNETLANVNVMVHAIYDSVYCAPF